MNKKDKGVLICKLYELLGAVVDIEELNLKSTTEAEENAINNLILIIQADISSFTEPLNIEL